MVFCLVNRELTCIGINSGGRKRQLRGNTEKNIVTSDDQSNFIANAIKQIPNYRFFSEN